MCGASGGLFVRLFLSFAFLVGVLATPSIAQSPVGNTGSSARIPVEAFGELPFLTDPVLSPDGNRVAAKVTVEGKPQIGIWPSQGAARERPRLISPGDNEIRWLRWAGDHRDRKSTRLNSSHAN